MSVKKGKCIARGGTMEQVPRYLQIRSANDVGIVLCCVFVYLAVEL